MNSIKEKVLRESYNYRGSYINEDYTLTNMVKGFVEDYKEFGEATADLYKTMFMLGDDVRMDLIQENIEYVTEMVNTCKTPFLFESAFNKLSSLNEDYNSVFDKKKQEALLSGISEQKATEIAAKEASKAFPAGVSRTSADNIRDERQADQDDAYAARGKYSPAATEMRNNAGVTDKPNTDSNTPVETYAGNSDKENFKDTRQGSGNTSESGSKSTLAPDVPVTREQMKAQTDAILAAPTPKAALKAASTAPTSNTSPDPNKFGGKIGPTGILGWISKAFKTVKGFFTGGVTSIGAAIKSGNWGALLAIPLVKGALLTGGAVLAFKIIKKLFGKRIKPNQEASLKAQLAAQGR